MSAHEDDRYVRLTRDELIAYARWCAERAKMHARESGRDLAIARQANFYAACAANGCVARPGPADMAAECAALAAHDATIVTRVASPLDEYSDVAEESAQASAAEERAAQRAWIEERVGERLKENA